MNINRKKHKKTKNLSNGDVIGLMIYNGIYIFFFGLINIGLIDNLLEGYIFLAGIPLLLFNGFVLYVLKRVGWRKIIDLGKGIGFLFLSILGFFVIRKKIFTKKTRYYTNDNNSTRSYFFTDKFIDFNREIRTQYGLFMYLCFGIGFILDFILLSYKFLLRKFTGIYLLTINVGIVSIITSSVYILYRWLLLNMNSTEYQRMIEGFSSDNQINGFYYFFKQTGEIEKYIAVIFIGLIFTYIVIVSLNILDILFGYKFKHIILQGDTLKVSMGNNNIQMNQLENEQKFIYKYFYYIFFGAILSGIIFVMSLGLFLSVSIESLRVIFWIILIGIYLYIILYIFFVFLIYILSNPIIISHQNLLKKLDLFHENNLKFTEDINYLKKGIISETLGLYFSKSYICSYDLQKYITKTQGLYFLTNNTQTINIIKNIVESNIKDYITVFDEVLELIDRNDDNFIGKSFIKNTENYKRKIIEMREKFVELNVK